MLVVITATRRRVLARVAPIIHPLPATEQHPPRAPVITIRGIPIVIPAQILAVVIIRNAVKEAPPAGIRLKRAVLSRAAPAPSVGAQNRTRAPALHPRSVTLTIAPATIQAVGIAVIQASAAIALHVIIVERMLLIVTAHQIVATAVLVRGSTRVVVRTVVAIRAPPSGVGPALKPIITVPGEVVVAHHPLTTMRVAGPLITQALPTIIVVALRALRH